MNLKKNIKKVLKEETNKFELVKNFIYTMFDDVINLEYNTERNEIMVYYDKQEELESSEICDTINKFTGLNVVPWYDYKKRTELKKDPDFYLDTERYEEELNENYSPAGKEITPNKIVIHKSNPKFRDRISNEGLKARAGECYKIYVGYGEKCIPAIFATNSTNKRAWFDSTYDDDVWTINTELIPNVKWYKDRHFESYKKHIVTFDNIPSEAIELMREGTGRDMIRESKEESQKEMIENVLNNIILPEYDHVICGFEVKVPNERVDDLGENPSKYQTNQLKFVSVTVTFIGGHGTKLFPQTQGIKQMYDNILDEIWQVIYNYTNEAVDTYYKTVNDCGKKNIYLKESIRKVLKEDANIKPVLNNLLNMLFDGFDDIYYDWAQYNCGMGVCCDPYAVGFVLPKNNYDDYLFKLVDGNNYDDNGKYFKEVMGELPEVCYEMPDVKNPNFNFIIFYEQFAEEIENYLGRKGNWKIELLELINEKFGCKATNIIFI